MPPPRTRPSVFIPKNVDRNIQKGARRPSPKRFRYADRYEVTGRTPSRYAPFAYTKLELQKKLEDTMFPKDLWPKWFRDSFFAYHLTNYGRFRFFGFMVLNGVHPDLVPEFVIQNGDYDYAAYKHVEWLKKKAKEDREFFRRFFDIELNQVL